MVATCDICKQQWNAAASDSWDVPHRNYSPEKITENVECEIMHVVVEEARESYKCVRIMKLQ